MQFVNEAIEKYNQQKKRNREQRLSYLYGLDQINKANMGHLKTHFFFIGGRVGLSL